MAGDVALGSESPNPCCAEIRKRYQKLEEKRNALRQAVKLLEQQTDKILNENANLKKNYEEERVQAYLEREAKEKEFSIRTMLEKELNELKAQKSIFQETGSFERDESRMRMLELELEIKRVKELLEAERKQSDSEKKKVLEEKKRSAEAWRLVKLERSKSEEERRLADVERKIAEECRANSEKMKSEANKVREQLVVEIRKAEDANKKVEVEKHKANKEKKHADSERAKVEEQRRLMQIERKKAMEEKACADNLLQKLNEERKKSEDLQNKIKDNLTTGRERISSCCRDGRCNSQIIIESADVKLLREQLKRKKEQVKYAKRILKLEKSKNTLIRQELRRLKQDFLNISCRFNMLDNHLIDSIEGIDHPAKVKEHSEIWGYNLQNCLLPPKSVKEQGVGLMKTSCLSSLNYSHSMRECTDLQLSRGSCTRPTSGISSELELPVGGSLGKKSQNSAACSYPTSFSDRTFMGSQGKDTSFANSSTELRKNSNWRSSIMKLKVPKTIQNQNISAVGKETDRRSLQENERNVCLRSSIPDAVNIINQMSKGSRKKRRIQDTLDSVARMYCEDDELHLKIREKVSDLKILLAFKACLPPAKKQMVSSEGGFQVENIGLVNAKSNNISSNAETNRQTTELRSNVEPGNQNHGKTYSMGSNRVSGVSSGTTTPLLAGEDAVFTERPSSIYSSDWPSFLCFEEMICQDFMKLLDLDNDTEERRYREAIEMPISPTLPAIEFPNIEQSIIEDSHNMVEGMFSKFETEGNVFMADFDVIDLEINSNQVKSKSSNSQVLCLDKSVGSISKTNLNHNDLLDVTERHPSIVKRDSNLSVKQVCAANKCNYLTDITSAAQSTVEPKNVEEFKTIPNCLLSHNEILNSESFDGSRSGCSDEPLCLGSTTSSFSQSLSHSEKLPQSLCSLNCISDIHDTSRNVSLSAIENNETLESTKDAKNDCMELQISGRQLLDCHISAQGVEENFQTGNSSPSTETGAAKQMALSTINTVGDKHGGYDEPERTAKYFVMFSNMKERNLARIVHYVNTVTNISQKTVVDAELLRKIASETELLPEEKASISFSLLLCIIVGMPGASSRFTMNGDFALSAGSFASEINRVIPDGESICLSLESCLSDVLVGLIEDFLFNKEVLMYNDRQYELSSCFPPRKFYLLDGSDMHMYSTAATTDQLVCGCVILASICATKDQIYIVLDTSYRILRMGRSDPSWTLLALHVFASICGEKLLCMDNDSSFVTAIRLLVSLLENRHKSSCPLSSLNSAYLSTEVSPCEQCPFMVDTVCMDNFVCSLLDQMQVYCFSSVEHLDADRSTAPLIYEIPMRDGKTKHKSEPVVYIDCHEGCNIYKYGKLNADQVDCFEKRLCYLTEIISLVELVGCYMSWEWTYNNVVIRLLDMLDSCRFNGPLAALVVLVGQLGRFGVDDGGYHQSDIAKMRGRLSLFIETNTSGKGSFTVQLSAVGSLLNLLPFTLKEIVNIKDVIPLDKSLFDHAIQIKKWFAQLSREQEILSCSLYTE
ncbi:uncharacterized protein [Typha latifolia]|uniref:uncharacterized protein n=1 Tax=Typha latifolia TaxID=4733 RepID=UPI003C30B83F